MVQKNHAINSLKFIAIVLVVCAHTRPFNDFNFNGQDTKIIYHVLDAFGRVTIPFLFMVTGYLLGKKISVSRNQTRFFKKYLLYIIKMFVSWAIFYQVYNIIILIFQSANSGLSIQTEFVLFIKNHFPFNFAEIYYGISTTTTYHLWYLTALIWSLIILFIFIKINKVYIVLMGSLIANLIGVFDQHWAFLLNMGIKTQDALFFGLFYLSLGYCLSINPKFERFELKRRKLLMLFFFFSFLQVLEGAVVAGFLQGDWGAYYFFSIPAALALFLYIINNRELGKNSIFEKMSNRTELIYVIHPLFISLILLALGILEVDSWRDTFMWNVVFTPVVLLLSYHMYYPLKMLKGRKQMLRTIGRVRSNSLD